MSRKVFSKTSAMQQQLMSDISAYNDPKSVPVNSRGKSNSAEDQVKCSPATQKRNSSDYQGADVDVDRVSNTNPRKSNMTNNSRPSTLNRDECSKPQANSDLIGSFNMQVTDSKQK